MTLPEDKDYETLDKEFSLYYAYARSLVVKMRNVKDRNLASTWILKLSSMKNRDDAAIRNNYMKVLLYCLTQRRIMEPFTKFPEMDAPLQDIPHGVKLNEFMQNLIKTDQSKIIAKGEDENKLPYRIEVSSDKKHYASVQEIPKFGVHCYFAISSEPIPNWENISDSLYETSRNEIETPVTLVGTPLIRPESIKHKKQKGKELHALENVEVNTVVVDIFEKQPEARTSQPALKEVQKPVTKIPMTQTFHATWRQTHIN